MKMVSLSLILTVLTGCQLGQEQKVTIPFIESLSSDTDQCPAQPQNSLETQQVESLVLNPLINKTGQIAAGKDVGYSFAAKAGQQLSFKTDDKVCIWLFSPEGKIIPSLTLPVTGKYVVQVSTLSGSRTFNLQLGLDIPKNDPPKTASASPLETSSPSPESQPGQTASPESQSSQTASSNINPFEQASYPQNACGDSMPSDISQRPVKFYPVYIEFSPYNLNEVKSRYCRDSLQITRQETGQLVIQVASFTSYRRAIDFSSFMRNKFNKSEVGEARIIE